MNRNKQTLLGLVLGASLLASSFAMSQSSPVILSSTGAVVRYTPDVLTITPADSKDPVVYSYTKATPYLDEKGNSVPTDRIQPGTAVTVFYENEGDKMIARKVIVGKPATEVPAPSGIVSIGTPGKTLNNSVGMTPPKPDPEASSTPSAPVAANTFKSDGSVKGMVTWVTTNEIQIKTPEITQPLHVNYTAATSYADEKGNPLSKDNVVTGQQVIVSYSRQGETMVANSVTIRKELGANEPASMHRRSATQGSSGATTVPVVDRVYPYN